MVKERVGGRARACLIVHGLSLETNYRFHWLLRRSRGRSHCCVKSFAKACVILQNDRAESLTATRRKHVNTLTDACYIEQLWWLFSWLGFHWTPPVPPSNESTPPRRLQDKNKLAKVLCNSFPRRKGHHVFEERSCQNHNASAVSVSSWFS